MARMIQISGVSINLFKPVLQFLLNRWILLILLGFVLIFSLLQPRFFSIYNFQNIGLYTTEVLILALGQTFVIISGGIDLSVGSVLGFSGITASLVMKTLWLNMYNPILSIALGTIAGLTTGTVLGMMNGLLIVKLKVPPFIATLGMLGIARGGTYLLTAGASVVDLPPQLVTLGGGKILGFLPVPVLIALILAIVAHFLLSQTPFGRYIYAMGGSRRAASRAGVAIDKYTILIYAFSGLFAAVSGVLVVARFVTGSPLAGANDELNSIAAVVIGGASLFGGTGSIFGSVAGALIIGVLLVGLIVVNVQPYWQMVAVGIILVLAVSIDQIRHRRKDEL